MPAQLHLDEQPDLQELFAPSLWSSAPAWRRLVIGSVVLATLSVSTPSLLPRLHTQPIKPALSAANEPESSQRSCVVPMSLQLMPGAPQQVMARVKGAMTQKQVLAVTARVEAGLGAKVNPIYLKWAHVDTIMSSSGMDTIAAIPPGVVVQAGDTVELNSRYRDPRQPCEFIPWTVDRVVKAAP